MVSFFDGTVPGAFLFSYYVLHIFFPQEELHDLCEASEHRAHCEKAGLGLFGRYGIVIH